MFARVLSTQSQMLSKVCHHQMKPFFPFGYHQTALDCRVMVFPTCYFGSDLSLVFASLILLYFFFFFGTLFLLILPFLEATLILSFLFI